MATSIYPLGIGGGVPRIVVDLDADATAELNVNDGAASIYSIDIDNAANAAIEYLKFYDNAVVTVGTTVPDMILMIHASVRRSYVFTTGVSFTVATSYAAVTAGGTAGTTGPTSDMPVYLVIG